MTFTLIVLFCYFISTNLCAEANVLEEVVLPQHLVEFADSVETLAESQACPITEEPCITTDGHVELDSAAEELAKIEKTGLANLQEYRKLVQDILNYKRPSALRRAGRGCTKLAATAGGGILIAALTFIVLACISDKGSKLTSIDTRKILATTLMSLPAWNMLFMILLKNRDTLVFDLRKMNKIIKCMNDEQRIALVKEFKHDFLEITKKISTDKDNIGIRAFDTIMSTLFTVIGLSICLGYIELGDTGENNCDDSDSVDTNKKKIPRNFSNTFENSKIKMPWAYWAAQVYLVVCFFVVPILRIKNLPWDNRASKLEILTNTYNLIDDSLKKWATVQLEKSQAQPQVSEKNEVLT